MTKAQGGAGNTGVQRRCTEDGYRQLEPVGLLGALKALGLQLQNCNLGAFKKPD